ncbi:MAG: hypothetical protein HY327_12225 [Chloroflexi bacterium]|nr:hypothetical protein [Chloroflexota bacterium]
MSETVTRQQVIELIDALPSETLPELVEFAEYLRHKTRPRDSFAVASSEQGLLEVIHRRLAPEQQHRLDVLRQKNESGQLTDAERAELWAYVEQVENADAQRAEALIELAHLRNVPVTVLMRDLTRKVSPVAN